MIVIVGPTAVGKTSTAIQLAKHFDTEIISADSRQFFKELTIGTAKPTLAEQAQAKHHFIDNKSITETYNASDFEQEVIPFLENWFKQQNTIVMCGGSGMYVNAVLNGFDENIPSANKELRILLNNQLKQKGIAYLQEQLRELDPEFYQVVDLHNSKRLLRAIEVCLTSGKPYSEMRKGQKKERNFIPIKIGIERERSVLYHRINQRVDEMIKEGLMEEAKTLIDYKDKNALKTVGYSEVFQLMEGRYDLPAAIEKIKTNSRRYAKRQLTWFKRDSEIKWFDADAIPEIIKYIRNRISKG